MSRKRAYLALADGSIFEGYSWGAPEASIGEVVFTTGMTGYQEVLTDPSFRGQLVVMTSPHIGNTGVNAQDPESTTGRPHAAGFIVREPSPVVSNHRSEETLDAYLIRHNVFAIGGVDTRKLTRHLRDKGSQNGALGLVEAFSKDELIERARSAPAMEGLDLVSEVTPEAEYRFGESRGDWAASFEPEAAVIGRSRVVLEVPYNVVAVDFGAKRNILRCLVDSGCAVTGVPARTAAETILAKNPEGVFLSSGPGDPAALPYAVETIKQLVGKVPIFGICLGHQLLARALGASTSKLKFGHRGLNQPVQDLKTGRVEITTQNHGFVVDVDSIGGTACSSHVHLNDGTSEGLDAPDALAFSVQYHPEAAAGPHDALYLFERFTSMMAKRR